MKFFSNGDGGVKHTRTFALEQRRNQQTPQ